MKQFSALLLLVSFIGLAVFGFLAMGHSGERAHSDCIASQARGFACPPTSDVFALADFHIGAFKIFSTAVFALMLSALFTLLALGLWFSRRTQAASFPNIFRQNSYEFLVLTPRRKFLRWMTLHEKRDPVFSLLVVSI